jgi:hypothetical protein
MASPLWRGSGAGSGRLSGRSRGRGPAWARSGGWLSLAVWPGQGQLADERVAALLLDEATTGNHAIAGASIAAGAPVVSAGAIGQVHGLSAPALVAGAPVVSGGAIGTDHAIAGASIAAGAPVVSGGAIGQVHGLSAPALVAGAPVVSGGAIGTDHAIAGSSLFASAPVVTGGAIGQVHGLSAPAVVAGAPTVSGGAIITAPYVDPAPLVIGAGVSQIQIIDRSVATISIDSSLDVRTVEVSLITAAAIAASVQRGSAITATIRPI